MKRKFGQVMASSRVVVFCLALLVVLAQTLPVSATTWTKATVDAVGDVGRNSSIACRVINGTQRVHISYYDITQGNLKHAYWIQSTGTWVKETVDAAGQVGEWTSIALDSNGRPHISYYDVTNKSLKYARETGIPGVWLKQTVDAPANGVNQAGVWTSITLDLNDNPHISYFRAAFTLMYARKVGANWSKEKVDSTSGLTYRPGVWHTSIKLDSGGNPHIAYADTGNYGINDVKGGLKYARKLGASWVKEEVDIGRGHGQYASLALDSGGNPHISYYTGKLLYARKVGGIWVKEILEGGQNSIGQYTSLALDSGGNPHISYRRGGLKYARKVGGSWAYETVDSTWDVGLWSSLALDSQGKPHISYFDFSVNANLKYARGL